MNNSNSIRVLNFRLAPELSIASSWMRFIKGSFRCTKSISTLRMSTRWSRTTRSFKMFSTNSRSPRYLFVSIRTELPCFCRQFWFRGSMSEDYGRIGFTVWEFDLFMYLCVEKGWYIWRLFFFILVLFAAHRGEQTDQRKGAGQFGIHAMDEAVLWLL